MVMLVALLAGLLLPYASPAQLFSARLLAAGQQGVLVRYVKLFHRHLLEICLYISAASQETSI